MQRTVCTIRGSSPELNKLSPASLQCGVPQGFCDSSQKMVHICFGKKNNRIQKKNVITHCLEKVHILRYSITIIIEKRSHPFIFYVCGRLPKMYKNSLHFFPGRGGRGPALSLGLDTDLIWLVGQWQMQHNQRLEKCLCPGACPLCPVGKPGPASWRGR